MPGAIPRTSTFALTNSTLPYALKLANLGLAGALAADPGLAEGLNVFNGHVTHRGVAEALQLRYTPVRELIP
jgi:alanine dehydrogenase